MCDIPDSSHSYRVVPHSSQNGYLMPDCHSCGRTDFADFHELAIHISGENRGHAKGKKWAANYILKNGLSAKQRFEHKERTPLTEDEKDARDNTHRELSGQTKMVYAYCTACKRKYPRVVEVEYIQSQTALRGNDGTLMITCDNCGGRS